MWLYRQATGQLERDGNPIASAYSGNGAGKNNPDMQHVANVGPIPVGWYTGGAIFDSEKHGPFCIRLIPDAENEMHGRDGFLMHGDSIAHPGEASKGCICAPRPARELFAIPPGARLQVVAR